jgi:hypothetical protein
MVRFVKIPAMLFILLAWAIVGLVIALAQDYGDIDSGSDAWTFVLAVVMWPLVLLGADVRIQF